MSDPWHHPHKECRETLHLAKELGWPAPVKASNHGWLVPYCPRCQPRCCPRCYPAPKGVESWARNARRKIKQCPHVADETPFDRVERLLGQAERLLVAAETELKRQDAANHALELLAEADGQLDQVDRELTDLEAEFEAAATAEQQLAADRDLLVEDQEDGWTPEEFVEKASFGLRTVRTELRDLPARNPRHQAGTERHDAAVARVTSLRARLECL